VAGRTVRGIIYDLDGTITRPRIPWEKLRREMEVPRGMTILEYLDSLPSSLRARKEEILLAYEREAAESAELHPGVKETVDRLRAMGILQALVTNNTMRSVETVLAKFDLAFDVVLTREHGKPKPSGDLLVRAVRVMKCGRGDVLFVGDSVHDAAAAREAGVRFLLLDVDGAAPAGVRAVRRFAEILDAAVEGARR